MERDSAAYRAQIVVKAIDLLQALASDESAATVPHLAKILKLNRKKVVELLETLEDKGLVERDGFGTYHLGLHSFSMAQNILKNANLIRIVHPVMESLSRKHEATVCFTVLDHDEVFFLDVVDSFQQIKATEMVGRRFPFFTNAAGKVIKSLSSLDLLGRIPGRRKKNQVHPDPHLLQLELDEIRKKGVAIDVGGFGDGVCTVAVAIRDYAGKVVGALTMLVPSIRLMQERLDQEIIPAMLEGAELLSGQFGYTRSYA
jgi:DNA-binding IclR family transcriptional regulator